MRSPGLMAVCYIALCRKLPMSGVDNSSCRGMVIFQHPEVFEDAKKKQMQMKLVTFFGQWLHESSFKIMVF